VFEVVFPSQPGPAHDPPRASCPSEELGVLADLGRGT
jgi:hypothetical protein